MKILISGSRAIINAATVLIAIEEALETLQVKLDPKEDILLCGMSNGVDMLAKSIMEEVGLKVEPYPAKWSEDQKRAGVLRTQKMVDEADIGIFIWDGISRGTSHGIRMMEQKIMKYPSCKMHVKKINLQEPQAA